MNDELQNALAAIKAKDAEGAKMILARLLQEEPDNVAAWVLMSRMAETEVQKAAFLHKILAIEPDHAYAQEQLAALQATSEEGETAGEAEPSPEAAAEGEEAQPVAEAQPDTEEQPDTEAQPEAVEQPEAEEVPVPREEAQPEAEEQPEAEAQREAVEQPESEEAVAEAPVEAEAQTMPPEIGLPLSTDPLDYEAQAEGDTLPPWMADEEVILEAPESAGPEGAGLEATGPQAAEEEAPPPEIPEWLAGEPEGEWLEQEGDNGEKEAIVHAEEDAGRPTTQEAAGDVIARPTATEQTAGSSSGLLLGLTVITIIVFLLLVYAAITFLPF